MITHNIRYANDWDSACLFIYNMYIYEESYFYNNILRKSKEEVQRIILNKDECYNHFSIPKKNGMRDICAIKKGSELYKVQVNLKKYFCTLPVSTAATGFVQGQSYLDFLMPHIGKKYYLRLDIKNFFGSVNAQSVSKSLKGYCSVEECAQIMTDICTLNECLPQGAVTSPVLSNIVFLRADQRILKYCQAMITMYIQSKVYLNDIIYTRYADDMLFSSNCLDFMQSQYFKKTIKNILHENGYEINYSKIKYGQKQISLNGYVLGADVHLSRKKMTELNRILYWLDGRTKIDHMPYKVAKCKLADKKELLREINEIRMLDYTDESARFNTVTDIINYLCGYRAFLISLDKANLGKTSALVQNQKRIKKIEKVVDKLNQLEGRR